MSSVSESTSGRPWFRGKHILITGGTGYVGKFIVEKLLRSLDVGRIYLLIRPKSGQSAEDRLRAYFQSTLFTLLTDFQYPTDRVTAIEGDLLKPRLGLDPGDEEVLVQNVQIVIHSAASVKFTDPLKVAFQHNVLGVKMVADLAERMTRLESYVHISTAYSFCERSQIGERLYPMTYDPLAMIGILESLVNLNSREGDSLLTSLESVLLEDRPNTYVYTKALAEHLIADRYRTGRLPAVIARPAIVAFSVYEPVPGFSDSKNGPMGLATLLLTGLVRTGRVNKEKGMDVTPVDLTANAIIGITWENGINRRATGTDAVGESSDEVVKGHSSDDTIKVYNVTFSDYVHYSLFEFVSRSYKYGLRYPSVKTIRTFVRPTANQSPFRVWFYQTFSELLFAYVADFFIGLSGNRKFLVKVMRRFHRETAHLRWFVDREWKFETTNLTALIDRAPADDTTIFQVDKRHNYDVEEMIKSCALGVRRYILKDPDETIPRARIQYRLIVIFWTLFQWLLLFGLYSLVVRTTEIGSQFDTYIGHGWIVLITLLTFIL